MPRSGVPENTGSPAAPAAKYVRKVMVARRGPVATAIAMTARVCRVIGTGHEGTWTFAQSVIRAAPKTMTAASCATGRWELVAVSVSDMAASPIIDNQRVNL